MSVWRIARFGALRLGLVRDTMQCHASRHTCYMPRHMEDSKLHIHRLDASSRAARRGSGVTRRGLGRAGAGACI